MERGFGMNRKGQTSIEFLFLFLIMLYYLTTVIQPAVDAASFKIVAVNRTGQAKLAAMKLANAINEIGSLSGDSRKTIWLFAEDCTEIKCNSATNTIDYNARFGMQSNSMDCTAGISNMQDIGYPGSIRVLQGITLNCSNFHGCSGVCPKPNTLIGYQTPKDKVIIEKNGNTVLVRST
ncbi:MAG: hypothetical protein V1493_04330 [Candidatus Diapherotrites archaeon]